MFVSLTLGSEVALAVEIELYLRMELLALEVEVVVQGLIMDSSAQGLGFQAFIVRSNLRGGPGGGGRPPVLPIITLDNPTPGVDGPRGNPSSPEVCMTGDGVLDESLTTAGWSSCRCDKVGVEGPNKHHEHSHPPQGLLILILH